MKKNSKKICVFASSSNYLDKCFYEDASAVGKLMGQAGLDIVYGGSSIGLMFACADEVKKNGGKLYGVMPEKLHNFGVSTDICDEFIVSSGMRERKAKMDELSDGVLALAGGFGTLEELTEMIVQKQLGYNNKPIVLLNTNGFYDKLAEFFEEMIDKKFAGENVRNLYFITSSVKDAVEYFLKYDYSARVRTKEEIYERV